MVKAPATAESFIRQQQEQLCNIVLQNFSYYGQPTCQLIRQALQQRNGLARLLERLGIVAPGSFEYQLKALGNYLKENGTTRFLRAAGGTADAPQAPAATEARKTAKEPPVAPQHPAPCSVAPAPAPEAAPQARPEAQAAAEAAPLFDAMGRYIGPERRSGIDRRSGTDRRGAIEAIFKNMRYGGDRRKVIRRKCDRELAAQLGLTPHEFPPPQPAK